MTVDLILKARGKTLLCLAHKGRIKLRDLIIGFDLKYLYLCNVLYRGLAWFLVMVVWGEGVDTLVILFIDVNNKLWRSAFKSRTHPPCMVPLNGMTGN